MTCHDDYPMTIATDTVQRVCVGIDGSAGSAAALRWAVNQAGTTDVQAVLVFETVYPRLVTASQQLAAQEQADAFVREALGESAGSVTVVAVAGEPRHVLLSQASHADLLVLGASHRTAAGARVLGSTASSCVSHADCPVMVVPKAWKPREAKVSRVPAA